MKPRASRASDWAWLAWLAALALSALAALLAGALSASAARKPKLSRTSLFGNSPGALAVGPPTTGSGVIEPNPGLTDWAVVLTAAAWWDPGYPRSVERSDGKIVTIYYFMRAKDTERYIAATIWDPGTAR